MGVAGLFAFLRRKYPEIVDACAQQPEEVAEGESTCDNLYLDLNHIIHVSVVGAAGWMCTGMQFSWCVFGWRAWCNHSGLPPHFGVTIVHPCLPMQACTHPTWRDVAHAGEEEQFMEVGAGTWKHPAPSCVALCAAPVHSAWLIACLQWWPITYLFMPAVWPLPRSTCTWTGWWD